MRVVSAHRSDIGRARKRNEDYVWVDEQAGVYVVADGLGGHEAGDVASRLAATTVGELIVGEIQARGKGYLASDIRLLMTDAIEVANERIYTSATAQKQNRPMSATIAVALVRPPVAFISHAGDVRAYMARNATLVHLTADDSVIARRIAAGDLSEDEARHHPQRHFVTKVVGQATPVHPVFAEVGLIPGDWFLLCSDGLWGILDDASILADLSKADDDPARAVESLADTANAAGGPDNISVIAMRVIQATGLGGG